MRGGNWDAPRALAAVKAGEMVLLDIRISPEWGDTRVAPGAWPIIMYDPGFGKALQAVLNNNKDMRIGIICATGGRTACVVNILRKNGYSDIVDVGEGMNGYPHGSGWLKRGLPVITSKNALAAISIGYRAK